MIWAIWIAAHICGRTDKNEFIFERILGGNFFGRGADNMKLYLSFPVVLKIDCKPRIVIRDCLPRIPTGKFSRGQVAERGSTRKFKKGSAHATVGVDGQIKKTNGSIFRQQEYVKQLCMQPTGPGPLLSYIFKGVIIDADYDDFRRL
jgi:hypothetical protein